MSSLRTKQSGWLASVVSVACLRMSTAQITLKLLLCFSKPWANPPVPQKRSMILKVLNILLATNVIQHHSEKLKKVWDCIKIQFFGQAKMSLHC